MLFFEFSTYAYYYTRRHVIMSYDPFYRQGVFIFNVYCVDSQLLEKWPCPPSFDNPYLFYQNLKKNIKKMLAYKMSIYFNNS